jgi:hypothetical protein
MIRRRLMLIAAPLCVVVVAASVAFASTTDTEYARDAKLDNPHAERPIAASAQNPAPLDPSSWLEAVTERRTETALIRKAVELELFHAVVFQEWAVAEAVVAELAAAAAAEEAAAAARAAAPRGGGSGGGGGAGGALACIRARESDTSGGYQAVSAGGTYRGAYQFLPSTWNSTAASAGRGDLVGVDPASASPGDQDAMAAHLYSQSGSQPWGGTC